MPPHGRKKKTLILLEDAADGAILQPGQRTRTRTRSFPTRQ